MTGSGADAERVHAENGVAEVAVDLAAGNSDKAAAALDALLKDGRQFPEMTEASELLERLKNSA